MNVENGAIEQPLKPMIRAATPVFDENNQKRGIIVINYLAEKLLSEIQDHCDNNLSEVMLLNSAAYWLLSPKSHQAWGFLIDDRRDHRFSLHYPEAWPFISHHPKGQVNTQNGLFVFSRIFPLLEGRFPPVDESLANETAPNLPDQYSTYYWILIHRVSPDRLDSFKNALVKKYLFFSISLLIIIAPGSWVMALETTRRRAQDAQLANLAMVDALTGLPNRRAFVERLNMDVARNSRHDRKLGLLYIDIDGFKAVNDTKGHDAGDALLVAIGETLQQHLRKSDMVARIGGDEFVCILAEIDSIDGALQAGKNLLTALSLPIEIDAGEVKIGASIGAAVFPDHATDVDALVKAADEAMYQAKITGKNNCVAAQT
ncbi:diguanylate cyclase (GGDEF) domain protein [Desulfosarcina variabilis str. Montpellier]